MPRSTHRYPFEFRVLGAVHKTAQSMLDRTDDEPISFILERQADDAWRIELEPTHEHIETLRASGATFIIFDPLDDGREYNWLEWQNVDRATLEQLTEVRFEQADFVSARDGEQCDYPSTWSVMF